MSTISSITISESLAGAEAGLAIAQKVEQHDGPVLIITPNMKLADQLQREIKFFLAPDFPVLEFPDWETLPYDQFSPHHDITSQRLLTLSQLGHLQKGVLISAANSLMHQLPPTDFIEAHSLVLDKGQQLNINQLRKQLENAGYHATHQVMEHGEFAVRGSLLDIYPMGSDLPYRIDLFDDEIDSMRTFDPENQRSIDTVEAIRLLPAHEFPLTKHAITHFREQFRMTFDTDPTECPVYGSISRGESAAGIEYYLPLFFEKTCNFFNYLPQNTLIIRHKDIAEASELFWQEINERYEQLRYDTRHPLLNPQQLFLQSNELFAQCKHFEAITFQTVQGEPPFRLKELARAKEAPENVLFCAESLGRREALLNMLKKIDIYPKPFDLFHEFIDSNEKFGIITAPLDDGLWLKGELILSTESQLFGQQVMQRRRRKDKQRGDFGESIRHLAELTMGSAVVHIDYGVGRYLGLRTLTTDGCEAEYLHLEYAEQAKIYVPVSSLHLISRYGGSETENAPLNQLGTKQWERTKRKAAERIRDVAAELLDIYAKRAAKPGFAFKESHDDMLAFANSFPFETTLDQQEAIDQVINDMKKTNCMDRLVCGDVGFGKTEVAMRAAFLCAQNNKQTAVLVPTTLLAEQHLQNFRDRFADWPIKTEALSRFRTQKEQKVIIEGLKKGTVDIVIGTHKLLNTQHDFKNLGLLIVDEEHRFGVRQKEKIKSLRNEVDILTLTATPIPRTLNMSMTGMRDLSIIATPPAKRLSVKTFVREHNKGIIREAVLRETMRGGQVYFLHNEVESIERIAREIAEILPESKLRVAHGQMRERELENIMSDFYHQRFNVLVCTTIIESGIDVPTANTIIINRADKLGLAQLHQLRGRVGRSHHQAYAYLLTIHKNVITRGAQKRLDAITAFESLGAGFMLASQDLEIRGAGELLGDEQSGHIHTIGFNLYMEMLDQTVKALKEGKAPSLEKPLHHGPEINLQIPSLIPESYIPDVHTRLNLYKRIADAQDQEKLRELQVEMIDRFGLLPEQVKNLFRQTELKQKIAPLGILKIKLNAKGGYIDFDKDPNIEVAALIKLLQTEPKHYQMQGQKRLTIKLEAELVDARFKVVERLVQAISRK